MESLEFRLPAMLNIPMAFLLQEHSEEKLHNFQDCHGFTFFHWAVATNDVRKVVELLHCQFDYSVCGSTNKIPQEILNNAPISVNLIQEHSIPFCKSGYSPIHLSIFLHTLYMKAEGKEGDKAHRARNTQYDIIKLFHAYDTEIFSHEDNSGYTVLDYCFLLENIDLIEYAILHNPSMNGLKAVHTKTALEIIEIYDLKREVPIREFNSDLKIANPLIKDSLLKKLQYEKLSSQLPVKLVGNPKKNKI